MQAHVDLSSRRRRKSTRYVLGPARLPSFDGGGRRRWYSDGCSATKAKISFLVWRFLLRPVGIPSRGAGILVPATKPCCLTIGPRVVLPMTLIAPGFIAIHPGRGERPFFLKQRRSSGTAYCRDNQNPRMHSASKTAATACTIRLRSIILLARAC